MAQGSDDRVGISSDLTVHLFAAYEQQSNTVKPFSRGRSELRSCVKAEVAILGSPSLISLMVSVDVKKHPERKKVQDPLD